MMVFLYIVMAILGISSIITFLIVFLINKSSNKDDYDEMEFAKTKEFNPDRFDDEDESFDQDAEIISGNLDIISENNEDVEIEEVGTEEELDKVDFLENTQTKLKPIDSDIKNKFDAGNDNKEELKELEKTNENLKLGLENEYTIDELDEDPVIKPSMVDEDEEII